MPYVWELIFFSMLVLSFACACRAFLRSVCASVCVFHCICACARALVFFSPPTLLSFIPLCRKCPSLLQAFGDLKHFETPYVVKMHNAYMLAEPQQCFTFVHPNPHLEGGFVGSPFPFFVFWPSLSRVPSLSCFLPPVARIPTSALAARRWRA